MFSFSSLSSISSWKKPMICGGKSSPLAIAYQPIKCAKEESLADKAHRSQHKCLACEIHKGENRRFDSRLALEQHISLNHKEEYTDEKICNLCGNLTTYQEHCQFLDGGCPKKLDMSRKQVTEKLIAAYRRPKYPHKYEAKDDDEAKEAKDDDEAKEAKDDDEAKEEEDEATEEDEWTV